MALIHKLRYGSTDIDLVDLDAIHVDEHFVSVVSSPTGDGSIPEYVLETLPVKIKAADEDSLAATLQGLHYAQRLAAEYWVDPQQTTPVWYHQKQDGETGERRALVRRITFQPSESYMTPPASYESLEGTILIERHPYWEGTTPRQLPNVTPSAAAAVSYDYTATDGAAGNRISNPGFESAGGGGADIWANWVESAGDGALAEENVIVHVGAAAASITAGASANTSIYQDVTVSECNTYTLSFYVYGDGANSGRYDLYDLSNSAYITSVTSFNKTAEAWSSFNVNFTTPDDCTSVRARIYCPTVNLSYFYLDDVYIRLTAHDIVGDVGARVAKFSMLGPASGNIRYLWAGIRSANKHGADGLTNFVPVWEAEDGSLSTDVSEDAASETNTASPGGGSGSYIEVVESAVNWDSGWHSVVVWTPDDAGYADNEDAYGEFLWLLRAKVTSGEWAVRLRYGYIYSYVDHDPVHITSTAWFYHEVGQAHFPPREIRTFPPSDVGDDRDNAVYLEIQATRVSGSGDLYIDCICPIPTDEGFIKLTRFIAASTKYVAFGESPFDQAAGFSTATSGSAHAIEYIPEIAFSNFRLPPGDGRIIAVYQDSTGSVLTNTIEFNDATNTQPGYYYERWVTLRGAE